MKKVTLILSAVVTLLTFVGCNNSSAQNNKQITSTMETIKTRKSVRSYLDKAVEPEKVKAIAEAGNMSAKAAKLSFYAITNPATLREVAETAKEMMKNSGNDFLAMRAGTPGFDPIYNAPAIVVVTAASSMPGFGNEINIASAGCAGENMLLAATALGLGSCYTVSPTLAFANPTLRAKVGMGEDESPICVIVFGYTDDTKPHAPRPENPANIKYID